MTNENMSDVSDDATEDTSSSFGEVVEREGSEEDEVQVEETAEEQTPTEETPEDVETEVVDQPTLTEKGTKLDSNPESAAHQLLANEQRKAKQYEQLLADPEALAVYVEKQFGSKIQPKVEPTTPVKTYKPEDFENLEGVADVMNQLQQGFADKTKTYEEQIEKLTKTVGSLLEGGRNQEIATNMSKDIESLRGVKELDPKSPDFIPGLEEDIALMYQQMDFDEQSGKFRGKYSIASIGNSLIATARKARQAGSLNAQTVVKSKSAGKVVTSSKVKDDTDDDNLNIGDSIAKGIAKTFR